jgi:hypothetical protein
MKDDSSVGRGGGAILNYAYVRQLNLQPGEVAAVRATLATTDPLHANRKVWALLTQFEGTPLPSQVPPVQVLAKTAPTDLLAFGTALIKLRQEALAKAATPVPSAPPAPTKSRGKRKTAAVKAPAIVASPTPTALVSDAQVAAANLLNKAQSATQSLNQNTAATPIGWLNLETIEMTPVGIERGELIATIPLAPLETTAVVQKEWSVTSQEFTSIVTDSLENYSETGVTENTELAQSTNSQIQHSNQFNVNSTVSGGIGFVTATGSASFQSQDQSSSSAQSSSKHAMATTKKASSRVKQSHKVTISTSTVTGTSETTTRQLQNPSTTNPIRIDYFSLMRKWHVGLYRYGLRLTYDIVIPEPGGTLREAYAKLAQLKAQMTQQFVFPYKHSDITTDTKPGDSEPYYLVLADKYSVDVPPPPGPPQIINVNVGFTHNTEFPGHPAAFTVNDGYWIANILYTAWHAGSSSFDFSVFVDFGGGTIDGNTPFNTDLCAGGGFLYHQSGQQSLTVYYQTGETPGGSLSFRIVCPPTDDAWDQWRSTVWTALYNAASSAFYTQQQSIGAAITTLQDQLNSVDTLTLRREEHDEIMKGVLRWVLGPAFEFMDPSLWTQIAPYDLAWGTPVLSILENQISSATDYALVSYHEQMIRFINDAIDWDNILYYLYSYFWDVPPAWDNIRQIQHPDSTRQAFLRAGAARVVLTVRKGWEVDWVNFVYTGRSLRPRLRRPRHICRLHRRSRTTITRTIPGFLRRIPAATCRMTARTQRRPAASSSVRASARSRFRSPRRTSSRTSR